MEMESKGFTKLTITDDLHSYNEGGDMVANITRLIESLLRLRDCLDNSFNISVSIDVSIGPDAEYLEVTSADADDDEQPDDEQPDEQRTIWKVGDQVQITDPSLCWGDRPIFGWLVHLVTPLPNGWRVRIDQSHILGALPAFLDNIREDQFFSAIPF